MWYAYQDYSKSINKFLNIKIVCFSHMHEIEIKILDIDRPEVEKKLADLGQYWILTSILKKNDIQRP